MERDYNMKKGLIKKVSLGIGAFAIFICTTLVIFAMQDEKKVAEREKYQTEIQTFLEGAHTQAEVELEMLAYNLETFEGVELQEKLDIQKERCINGIDEVSKYKKYYNSDEEEYKKLDSLYSFYSDLNACADDTIKYIDNKDYKDYKSAMQNLKLAKKNIEELK